MRLYFPTTTLRSTLQLPTFIAQQCRPITLYHAVRAKRTHGAHKVADFTPYSFPKLGTYLIDIWQQKPKRCLGRKNLKEALRELGGPGILFHPDSPMLRIPPTRASTESKQISDGSAKHQLSGSDPENKTNEWPKYTFQPMKQINPTKIKKVKVEAYKQLQFTESSANSAFFVIQMMRARDFLERRIPVEFTIRGKSKEHLETIVRRNAHLHCLAILSTLPEGSKITISPQTTETKISWVVEPRIRFDGVESRVQTDRFYSFREMVLDHLEKGINHASGEKHNWKKEDRASDANYTGFPPGVLTRRMRQMRGDNYPSPEGKKWDGKKGGFIGVIPKERIDFHEPSRNLRDVERPWSAIRRTPNLPRRGSVEELRQDMIRMEKGSKF